MSHAEIPDSAVEAALSAHCGKWYISDYITDEDEAKEIIKTAISAALPHLLAAQWRPIENAPKDGTVVLLREPRCSGMAAKYLGGWKYESGGVCYLEPTHWQPLPPPPTGDQA